MARKKQTAYEGTRGGSKAPRARKAMRSKSTRQEKRRAERKLG